MPILVVDFVPELVYFCTDPPSLAPKSVLDPFSQVRVKRMITAPYADMQEDDLT